MFTGSTATGRQLAEQLWPSAHRFLAELGGKERDDRDPGANLDKVAKAATGRVSPTPGSCASRSNAFYVETDVADRVHPHVRRGGKAMKLGTAYDFRRHGQPDLRGSAQDGIRSCRRRKGQGRQRDRRWTAAPGYRSAVLRADRFDRRHPEMECFANETFGPLVSIYPVTGVEEAIEKANDTEYGLNASVWAAWTPRAADRRTAEVGNGERQRGLRICPGKPQCADGRNGCLRCRSPPRR